MKKLKNDEMMKLKIILNLKKCFQLKKLQLREQVLNIKGKEIEGLMWFLTFKSNAIILHLQKIEKKQSFFLNK